MKLNPKTKKEIKIKKYIQMINLIHILNLEKEKFLKEKLFILQQESLKEILNNTTPSSKQALEASISLKESQLKAN